MNDDAILYESGKTKRGVARMEFLHELYKVQDQMLREVKAGDVLRHSHVFQAFQHTQQAFFAQFAAKGYRLRPPCGA